ncbi:hypothetical protein HBNXHr_2024 [Halorhabdus sp. BNX81]|nr:hypothetical protein HBNXHr_2024 [Halorhabdus sp. BNX81]
MSDWSADESDGGWSDDRPETERGTHETDVEWAADESETEPEQQRLPGRHLLPTLRWAVRILRESPFLVVVALVASSVELFVLQSSLELFVVGGDLLRWGVLFLDIALVAALAAVVAEDALEDRHRTVVAQFGAFLGSLPALFVTITIFAVPLYFGVFLPSSFFPIVGLVVGVILGGYLLALFPVVVPAVVLDRSVRQGRTAFAEDRFSAVGLLSLLFLGHAPLGLLPPALAEPVLAMVLAVWAGVVTAVVTLAYTRIYVIHCPKKQRQSGSQGGGIPREMEGRHGMWQQQSDGA